MTDVSSQTVMITLNLTSAYENENTIQLDEAASTTTIPLNSSAKAVGTVLHNDRGYYIDDVDDGLNDLQVLFLACFLTLIPLIISVVAAFGIRILWVKYSKRRKGSTCDGMLERDGTIDSMNKPLHSHLLNSDKIFFRVWERKPRKKPINDEYVSHSNPDPVLEELTKIDKTLLGIKYDISEMQRDMQESKIILNELVEPSSNVNMLSTIIRLKLPLNNQAELESKLESGEDFQDLISCDTHLDLSTEEVEICDSTVVNTSQVRSNHSSTNGSIITMTLKNNHLIVETEERNDIEADSRETTMRYSPGARDGIFIVEVQQGVRRSPTATSTASTSNFNVAVNISDQCALVHNNADSSSEEAQVGEPDDMGYTETSLPEPIGTGKIKTGLTQSTSSLSDQSYNYTNQQCYDNEGYGYNLYNGYVNDQPLKRSHYNQKLKITSAIYKNPSKSMDLDAPPDGFLLSDLLAVAVGNEDKTKAVAQATTRKEGDIKNSGKSVSTSGAS